MTSLRQKVRRGAEYIEMVRRRPLLLFEITSRCNQECRFCYNGVFEFRGRAMIE